MDEQTWTHFKNQEYRVFNATEHLHTDPDGSVRLSKLWQIRLHTIYKLLEDKVNVLLTDTDLIYLNHYKLEDLPHNFDIYHTQGGTFPKWAYEKWGFTICGCLAGYRSTSNTRQFLKFVIKSCKGSVQCDDQAVLNSIYSQYYDMEFFQPAGMSIKIGKSRKEERDLKVLVMSEESVKRGGEVSECLDLKENRKTWVLGPHAPKVVAKKLTMFKNFEACIK